MKQSESICPLLTVAKMAGFSALGYDSCVPEQCIPDRCMWAMRKTAKGEDGTYRTVGYRCAIATGSDRYIDIEEVNERWSGIQSRSLSREKTSPFYAPEAKADTSSDTGAETVRSTCRTIAVATETPLRGRGSTDTSR